MNKKALSVLLSGILSISLLVGCGNDEAEDIRSQEQQVQQEVQDEEQSEDLHKQDEEIQNEEQIVDEDLNEEYTEEVSQTEQLEMAKTILEEVSKEHMAGYRYKITSYEESNSVMFMLHATSVDVAIAINDGSYNELIDSMLYLSTEAKGAFERLGLNANCSVCLADLDNDKVWFSTFNETILFDVTDELE